LSAVCQIDWWVDNHLVAPSAFTSTVVPKSRTTLIGRIRATPSSTTATLSPFGLNRIASGGTYASDRRRLVSCWDWR